MALISLGEAKEYLRVDAEDEDAVIGILLSTAEQLCADVARLDEKRWAVVSDLVIDEDGITLPTKNKFYTEKQLKGMRAVLRGAVLYALAYLYEHREDADHRELTLTLRAILSPIREGMAF